MSSVHTRFHACDHEGGGLKQALRWNHPGNLAAGSGDGIDPHISITLHLDIYIVSVNTAGYVLKPFGLKG